MKHILLTSALALTMGTAAQAKDYMEILHVFLQDEVRGWAQDTTLIDAIRAQNAVTGSYSQDEIDALDLTWRDTVGSPNTPLIANVLEGTAADFLRTQVDGSYGMITEVFIMDARGLNVAASAPTSDYWQGDEAKFQQTYLVGPDAEHFSDIEFDDSTQSYQAQLSFTIVDSDTGQPIGAITVGVDATTLM